MSVVYHHITISAVKYNSLAFYCVGFFCRESEVRARSALTSVIICMASTLADWKCTSDGEAVICSRRGVWPESRATNGNRRGSLSTWKQTTRYGHYRGMSRADSIRMPTVLLVCCRFVWITSDSSFQSIPSLSIRNYIIFITVVPSSAKLSVHFIYAERLHKCH